MLLRQALREQYHAGLVMLADCIEKCPGDLWTFRTQPQLAWRTFWQIAFHAAYFTHLYLGQTEDAFQPWPDHPNDTPGLWQKPLTVEPYELPEGFAPYTKTQMLAYLAYVDSIIDLTVDALDLDAPETGFDWYRNMNKLSHELMNLRHLQGHVGQLSELLMSRDIDIEWVGKASRVVSEVAPDARLL